MEIYKPITGYENLYEVSNLGNVRSLDRMCTGKRHRRLKGKVLRQHLNEHGYPCVDLCKDGVKRTTKVHQLVAREFVDNPNHYPVINHKDSTPTNNRADNLEWCSQSYNIAYAYKEGGKKYPRILGDEHVKYIVSRYRRYDPNNSFRAIGDVLGVSWGTVRKAYLDYLEGTI